MDDFSNQQQKDNNNEKSRFSKNTAEIIDWIKYIAGAFIIAFLLSNYVIVNAYVPTESMMETIKPKSRLIANRLHYLISRPARGDIVVFRYPDDEKTLFVKRVIGLPGETVEVIDGEVFINDEKLDEPYIRQNVSGNFGPYQVPQGTYFMMGDNRNSSWDSRYWTNKYVNERKILGKVFVLYYPQLKYFGI